MIISTKSGRAHDASSIEARQHCCLDDIASGIDDALNAVGVGATTASDIAQVATPALVGAGVGAIGGAIGGSPGTGALAGGALGALYGGYNVATDNGQQSLGQALGLSGGSTGVPGAGNVSADNGGGTVTDANGNLVNQSDASANNPTDTSTGSVGSGGSSSGGGGGGSGGAAGTTKGINGTTAALGVLAAIGSALAKKNSTQPFNAASLPGPSTTAATQGPLFNANMNPTGFINRTPTNPVTPGQGYTASPTNSNQNYASSYFTYGPTPVFYSGNQLNLGQATPGMARGGAAHETPLFDSGSGDSYVQGPGDGQSDDVNAKLADGEYVIDATTVSRLGQGSNRKGAQRLDEMRHAIAHDAGSDRVVQKKTKSPLQYLAGDD